MKHFLVAVLAAVVAAVSVADDRCPPADMVKPCECSSDDKLLYKCENVSSLDTLISVFNNTADRSFPALVLLNSELLYLPASRLVDKKVRELILWNVSLIDFFDDDLPDSNKIESLQLLNTTISSGLDWTVLGVMKELKHVIFTETEARRLTKAETKNLSNETLYLEMTKTRTTEIGDGAFAHMQQLSEIHIEDNEIDDLKRSMFPDPAIIKRFYFGKNHIESLPDDMFTKMPNLTEVSFRDNRLTHFKESVFSSIISQVDMIDILGNPLVCDCSVKWIVDKKVKNVNGTCSSPSNFAGKNVWDLKDDDFSYCNDNSLTRFLGSWLL